MMSPPPTSTDRFYFHLGMWEGRRQRQLLRAWRGTTSRLVGATKTNDVFKRPWVIFVRAAVMEGWAYNVYFTINMPVILYMYNCPIPPLSRRGVGL